MEEWWLTGYIQTMKTKEEVIVIPFAQSSAETVTTWLTVYLELEWLL